MGGEGFDADDNGRIDNEEARAFVQFVEKGCEGEEDTAAVELLLSHLGALGEFVNENCGGNERDPMHVTLTDLAAFVASNGVADVTAVARSDSDADIHANFWSEFWGPVWTPGGLPKKSKEQTK